MKKTIALGALLAGTAVAVSSCSKAVEPFQDAPRDGRDSSPAKIINMPDGFSNLATKCVDGVRYTVAFHGDHTYAALTTVVDPRCR